MPGVEIYLTKANIELVITWLDSKLERSDLKVFDEDREFCWYRYDGLYQDRLISVIITPSEVNKLSIWFNGEITPWESSLECAREAFKYLKIPIICDPGSAKYPYPGDFMLIDANGERIICLDEG